MAKGRILAIDDEPFFRTLYLDLLGAEGYQVRAARSGREGLDWLRREEFDLVITDMDMEEMNGVETAAAIRRFNPEQEIIVVTAREDTATVVAAMKRGVAEYLTKPLNPEEFLLVVNRIMFRQSLGVEHQRLVNENLEFASTLAYYGRCLNLLKIHDLDRLGDLILDTLMELLRAEGAALWLLAYDGRSYRLRCRRGLFRVTGGNEVFEPEAAEDRLLLEGKAVFVDEGHALWLPLRSDQDSMAVIRVEAPTGRSSFTRNDLRIADIVGEFAASALHNVLLFRSLEHDSLRLPRSQAYKMSYFREHVEKELHKARRYHRHVSFVKLTIDNYAELTARFNSRDLDEAVARVIETVNSALRDADIMSMPEPGIFYILLPETDYWGSLVTQKRIRRALAGQLTLCDLKKTFPIQVLLRSAAFPVDGTQFPELIHAAAERLERLKDSLWCTGRFGEAPFWSAVGKLLGSRRDYRFASGGLEVSPRLTAHEAPLASRYLCMPRHRADEILRGFCREVVESRRVRGVMYLSCEDFDEERYKLRFLEGIEQSSTSLYLLGGKRRVDWDFQHIHPIYIEDRNFSRVTFLLYLNENYAYGLFAWPRGEELVGFHTSDFYFVENMIARLQEQYQLQPRI